MKRYLLNKIKLISLILFIALTTCFLASPLAIVNAQEDITISLANSRNEINLSPGQSQRVMLTVLNKSSQPITGNLKVLDFIIDGETDKPYLLEGQTGLSSKFAAASWIKLPSDLIAVAPDDQTNFDVTVSAPIDALPGGHYAAVMLSVNFDSSKESSSGSNIIPRIVSLFLVNIAGEVKENAVISKFLAPFMVEYGPVKITSAITNRSNTHISPKGFFTITDWFGRTLTQDKLETANIFPDTTKNYENLIGNNLMIGRYKVTLSAAYGNQGKIVESYRYFWIIPWRLIISLTLALAIVIIFLKNRKSKTGLYIHHIQKKLKEEEQEIENLKKQIKKKFF